jgi:beta-lactamase class A
MLLSCLLGLSLMNPSPQSYSTPQLQAIAQRACEQAITHFPDEKIKADELEISLAVLDRKSGTWTQGDVNGDKAMYPASVVKLLYAAYLGTLLDSKKVKLTPELDRAVKDMLVESSNDATGLVLDVVTGTTGGPELPEAELKKWMEKRQAVNKWLTKRGYRGQNACQKTWNEGPYGRERQGYGPNMALRNSLTPNACLGIMAELALGKICSLERTAWLTGYLKRVVDEKGNEAGGQTKGFIGEALPRSWERYSKAGWAYQVRHDVAWFRVPDGREFILCIFTDHHGNNEKLLPFMTSAVLKGLELESNKS